MFQGISAKLLIRINLLLTNGFTKGEKINEENEKYRI